METLIGGAVMSDYENLCALLAEGDALHSARLPDRFCPPPSPEAARTREYISGLLADPNASIFVAEQDGQIAGAIITFVRDTPPIPILTPRRYASIDMIVVRQDKQGCEVGRALLNRAEAWAYQLGATKTELNVYFFNEKAIRFYKELGYEGIYQKMEKKL